MGQNPTEEEIFQMISQVDDDNSGEIEFAEWPDAAPVRAVRCPVARGGGGRRLDRGVRAVPVVPKKIEES